MFCVVVVCRLGDWRGDEDWGDTGGFAAADPILGKRGLEPGLKGRIPGGFTLDEQPCGGTTGTGFLPRSSWVSGKDGAHLEQARWSRSDFRNPGEIAR